jgi:predicted Zn-dependent protease
LRQLQFLEFLKGKEMRGFFLIILLLLFSFGTTACQTTTTHYPGISKEELAKERKIQKDLAAQKEIEKKNRAERKRLEHQQRLLKVSQRIRKGGMELCKKLNRPIDKCLYEFELTKNTKAVNAYANGKKIYVTPAMMNFAKTDEELAVVLGHEYAHNVMDHIKSKKANALIGGVVGFAFDLLAASQGINTSGALSDIGQSAGALSYSQDFEKEADYVGLYVTALSGYAIKDAPNFWRRMSLNDSRAITEASTHPSTPERFVALTKVVSEIRTAQRKKLALMPKIKQEDVQKKPIAPAKRRN